jgi:alginate O-acetyltransferase complex protein AlgJ
MRFYRLTAGLVALVFVFGPALLWLGGARPEAFENRPLTPPPAPEDGWSALDSLGPWATDHLPGRADAVHLKAWTDFHLLGTMPGNASASTRATFATPYGRMRVAPTVVRGRDGHLFLGRDFDRACAKSRVFRTHLRRMGRLAHLIEQSGRKVAYFVGPDKSSVDTDGLRSVLPHGECTQRGLARQRRILDKHDDPAFVGVRDELAREQAAGRQVFWKTDTHWSSPGTAILARALADRLEPGLGDRARVRTTSRTQTGDLIRLVGLDSRETAPAALVEVGGQVRETSDSDHFDPARAVYGVHRWTTGPGSGPIPGRTVLVGDSFTYFALDNLRPLFAEGEFLWFGHGTSEQQAIDAIVGADTVVLEVVQRELVGHKLISPGLYRKLRAALAADASREPARAARR